MPNEKWKHIQWKRDGSDKAIRSGDNPMNDNCDGSGYDR